MKFISTFLLFTFIFLKETESAPAIVQGQPVDILAVPFQAALLTKDQKVHFCGGSFLKLNFVITAAHCMLPDKNGKAQKNFTISGGSSTYGDGTATELEVLEVFVNPNYNVFISDFDAALVKFENTPSFPTSVNLVTLPPIKEYALDGELMIVSGWGKTQSLFESSKYLRAVMIPIYNQEKCISAYDLNNQDVTDRMICAGFKSGSFSLCSGDSGGPLVHLESKTLYGIASFVGDRSCGSKGLPSVFTRVSAIREWIVEVAGDDNFVFSNDIIETTTKNSTTTKKQLQRNIKKIFQF